MYRKVGTSNTSHLEAHIGIYRLLMKGIFDAYVLWPFDKKFVFELVTWVNTHDFTIFVTITNAAIPEVRLSIAIVLSCPLIGCWATERGQLKKLEPDFGIQRFVLLKICYL